MNRIKIRGTAVASAVTAATLAAGMNVWAEDGSAASPVAAAPALAPAAAYSDEHTDQINRAALARARIAANAAATARARAAAQAARQARAVAAQRASRSQARAALASGSPQDIARVLAAARGWGAGQFRCLVSLWSRESGWSVSASNASSGAYGIPQALPGSKMAAAGPDWRTSARTQIAWGLGYIAARYGSPCAAWSNSQANGWY